MLHGIKKRVGIVVAAIAALGPVANSREISAAEPKPAFVAPKQLETVAAPAAVRVTQLHPIAVVNLGQLAASPLPDWLDGATAIARPMERYPSDARAGAAQIEVLEDGPVVIAACHLYDGSVSGRWNTQKFCDQGWVPFAPAKLFNTANRRLDPHTLYLRYCKAGEKFTVQSRLQHPPLVIVPGEGCAPSIADLEAALAYPELLQRESVRGKAVALLEAKQFDELETWAGGFVKDDGHFPSGRYKITEVYQPFSYPMSSETEEKFLRRHDLLEEWLRRKPDSAAARLVLANHCIRFSVFLRFNKKVRDGSARADEMHRRALEVCYEVEQSGPPVPDLFTTLMTLAGEQGWDEELAMSYADKALEAGRWCPDVIIRVHSYLMSRYGSWETVDAGREKIRKFVDDASRKLAPRYGDALYAAVFIEGYRQNPAAPLLGRHAEWPRMKSSFEELERCFPNSRRNQLLFCRFAAAGGDRETTRRLFEQLGEIDVDEEEIWSDAGELAADRAWAAADFTSGEQSALIELAGTDFAAAVWLESEDKVAIGDSDSRVLKCAAAGGRPEFYITPIVQAIRVLALGPEDRALLVGGWFRNLSIVDLQKRRSWKLNFDHEDVTALGFSHDGRRAVAGGSDGGLSIYDVIFRVFPPSAVPPSHDFPKLHGKPIKLATFTRDDSAILSLAGDGTVVVADAESGQARQIWKSTTTNVAAAALSPQADEIVIVGTDNRLSVWGFEGKMLREVRMTGARSACVAVSPDGRWIAVGVNASPTAAESIRLYDAKTLEPAKTFTGHKGQVVSIAFSKDGAKLLTASRDRSARVWDVPE